jgi:hypothetical protein
MLNNHNDSHLVFGNEGIKDARIVDNIDEDVHSFIDKHMKDKYGFGIWGFWAKFGVFRVKFEVYRRNLGFCWAGINVRIVMCTQIHRMEFIEVRKLRIMRIVEAGLRKGVRLRI